MGSEIPYNATILAVSLPQPATDGFLGINRYRIDVQGLFIFYVDLQNSQVTCSDMIIRKYGFVIEDIISVQVYTGNDMTYDMVS